ncbi:RTA1 like protein-domain-containing protein [Bisporella sp. PMI_857]|nr:RTA1 like protein-domain-containing protein [Bisporella sp. PMI_857]
MPQLLPLKSGYYIWKYVPSVPAAAISAILWITITAFLGWRMFRTRTWFCSAFVIGCFMEFIGFCARASAANKTNKLMPYIIQSTYILLPPTLFAATIYMCLGRIIRLVGGEHLSIVNPRRLTWIFVGGDVLSFVIQGGASGLMVMGSTKPTLGKLGNWMIVFGLVIQLISFSLFGLTAILFHTRLRRSPTLRSYQVDQSWVKRMWMLYSVSVLIIIRSIFRIVEFIMGSDGYPLTHEWTLYMFDTLLMLIVAVHFYLRYPDSIVLKEIEDIQVDSLVAGERGLPNKTC